MAESREPIPKKDEDVLTENREELIEQLIATKITKPLLKKRVIDLDDLNETKQEERQHGRRAGVEKLLDIIHHSGPNGFDKFIESLKCSNYDSLANRLQVSRQTKTQRTEYPRKPRTVKLEITEKGAAAESITVDTRCIILLGWIGVGKSSLGNNLLGARKFSTIKTKRRCQIERTDNMVVMDTPGIFSKLRSDTTVAKEIMNTIEVNKLLIHVYILVLSNEERLSGDEIESVEYIKKLFGENVIKNMIIVFTGSGLLEDDESQFPRCLPQLPYFLLDFENLKQEAEAIRKEIFSQKYKNIPHVFDVEDVDWVSIKRDERRRKGFKERDFDMDAVQNISNITQSDGNSLLKPQKLLVKGASWIYNNSENIVPCKYNCGVEAKRREILSHYEICSEKPQECEYMLYGCDFEGNPEQMKKHEGKNIKQHLKLVTVYSRTRDSDPSAQQQVGILKNGEELSCLVSELTKEVNNRKHQMKNMDGAAGGTQFASNNAMADSVSKQLSAHKRKLENIRIGEMEMEAASYDGVFTLKKKDDYKRKQDSINEKNGDEVQSWHKEILNRHYESIIKNIRVNDIIDHLFGSEVIDENDMDVIKTKLKSDGNRKALGHLLEILLNSSHTVLTTFINCLHKTRYEHIATRLQEDMDNFGGVGGP